MPPAGFVISEFAMPWTKETLTTAQTALKTLGLYTLKVDGIWGPGTEKAVVEYAKSTGMTVDDPSKGIKPSLLANMGKAAASKPV